MKLPWTVVDSEDWGLVIENSEGGCVAFFAYPDDPERRTYSDARSNAEAICAAMNAMAHAS